MSFDKRPLVLHVMYRFDTGGLENGVVNLINHMPSQAYRHAVLALTEVTDFSQRIQRRDVEFISLRKPPGHGVWQYAKLFKLFRQLRPAIVHSRNLAALEVQIPAWAARAPVRIHGEHGRDVGDLDGNNVTYQRVRRFYKPFVHHYLALSRDLAGYLADKVQVPQTQITQACNGVDTQKFRPATAGAEAIAGCPFDPAQHWLVGTVGRMQTVKDQLTLAQAFVQALAFAPELTQRLRLVMVGAGPLRAEALALLDAAGVAHLAWLPGERSDVADIMRGLHAFALPSLAEGISNTILEAMGNAGYMREQVMALLEAAGVAHLTGLPGERTDVADIMRGLHAFALPSLAEGISNTILEAMASALPVIATDVGGNADLLVPQQTGYIVPRANPEAMARGLIDMAMRPSQAQAMGEAGRQRVLANFSLQAMVSTYQSVYDHQLQIQGLSPQLQEHH